MAQVAMAVLPGGRRKRCVDIPIRRLLLGYAAPPRLVLKHRRVLRLSFAPFASRLPLYSIGRIFSIVRTSTLAVATNQLIPTSFSRYWAIRRLYGAIRID